MHPVHSRLSCQLHWMCLTMEQESVWVCVHVHVHVLCGVLVRMFFETAHR